MIRTMNSTNRNKNAVWQGVVVLLTGTGIALVLLGGACQQVFAQAPPPTSKPAAAKSAAAKPAAADPAAKTTTQPAAGQPAASPAPKPATAPAKAATPAKAAAGKDDAKEEPPPPPENSFLRTKDGWNIFCTFYGPKKGVRPGKAVVPIIMLHGWQGQGSEYAELATLLQSWGFASIVPDLRGHGRSLNVIRRKPNGEEEDKAVKAEDLTPQDLEGMVNDVEAMKRVLVEKNNQAELNIEMLTVIAAEVGTIVALNWSALDWSWPIMPAFKQGQDVKALVLLTPQQTFKRMNASTALNHQAISRRLSVMIAVGDQQTRDFSEAKRIHSRLERLRPPVAAEERLQKQDLFLIPAPTPMQGVKLLDRALPVVGSIMKFLELRLLRKLEDFPWTERRNPLGGN
jgi:pimeloyl-ACP methyl ester carboxylesterase